MKNPKQSAVRLKSHVLNPNLFHIATVQCNKFVKGIKLLKSLLYEVYCRSKNLKILHFNIRLFKKSENLRCKEAWYIMHATE